MLEAVVGCLACPNCGAGMAETDSTLRCANGHSFDIARQGYVNLLPPGVPKGSADTAVMVAARHEFLSAGHFAPIADAVAHAAEDSRAPRGCVVEVGAGTGYYLAHVLERLPADVGLALDLSKYAARRAARAHPRMGAAVADTWRRIPVHDGATALVLDVFAPRNAEEFARVLSPGGALITVTPTPRHLRELVDSLGLLNVEAGKEERLGAQLAGRFEATARVEQELRLSLAPDDVRALVGMGPSAWHAEERALERRLASLGERTEATASVAITTWRPRVSSA